MSKKASLIRALNFFVIFFCVILLEEIFVGTRSTYYLVSCIIGIIGIVIYLPRNNKSLEGLGFIFTSKKLFKGLWLSLIIAAASIGLVVVCEELFFLYLDNKGFFFDPAATIFFYNSKFSIVNNGIKTFFIAALIGVLVSFIRALFFEGFFRGLMIRLNAKAFGFNGANIIQAILFTLWFIVVPIKNLIGSTGEQMRTALIVLVLFIVYEFTTAFRLGLIRRATGSIWACVFNFFFFDIFNNFFYSFAYFPEEMAPYYKLIRAIIIQLVAFLITIVYYNIKMKKIIAKREALEASGEAFEEDDDVNFVITDSQKFAQAESKKISSDAEAK